MDSLGYQSHFPRVGLEPMETREMIIKDCGEEFQNVFGQVGEKYVKRFHGPDTPPQEIRRVHSSARINLEFGRRVLRNCKQAGTFGPVVPCTMRSGFFFDFLVDS